MFEVLFNKKAVDKIRAEATSNTQFKRTLGTLDLVLLGIGAVIGAGIFVLPGRAAAANAGPAVVLSFLIASIAAGFAGLCYAEMASMLPVSGSAYAYTYVTMGELVAWIIGWDLILEYLVGAATVSVGWSGYFVSLFRDIFGITLSEKWTHAPITWNEVSHSLELTGAYFNFPAVFITLFMSLILIIGIRESARFNSWIVFIKVAILLLFIGVAMPYIHPENWHPFIPPNTGTFGKFGISGVFQGATMMFFAYIGFDAVSTAAQECKNPQKDLPIGILGSLVICTLLYIVVSSVLTGVVNYTQLSVPDPIAVGIAATGNKWLGGIIHFGAIAGLSSVILVMLLGQSRIFYSMAQDGLLPPIATKIHKKFRTPYITTVISGVCGAIAAGLLPIEILGELTSIGTLFAFVLVSLGVMILRIKRPDIPRRFKVPGGTYLIPVCGVFSSGLLMFTATSATLIRLFVWMGIGLIIYAFYGRKRSQLLKK